MRRIFWLGIIALGMLVACVEEPPPEPSSPIGARIELASGNVWLMEKGSERAMITGAMLPDRAKVKVGSGGRALIRLGNGTGLFLRGGTEVAIEPNGINLSAGELWADIPEHETDMGRIVTNGVIVTASGAGFDVLAGDSVEVYVARGLAVVAGPGGRSEVETGERALLKEAGKGAPQVEPVAFWEDWTGGMADRELLGRMGAKASGRIYGIDRARPGSTPEQLQITAQNVKITIRDGIAHTTVDQRFFNPAGKRLEGWYWFTVPEGASVEGFALEVDGKLIDGKMIERKQAKAAYTEAIKQDSDPALLEWVDGRTFRARIYPIPPAGERHVVLSYTELLPLADGVYRYVYPMGGDANSRIEEFSLSVDLGEEGKKLQLATLQDARIEKGGELITMRRSGYMAQSDFLLELKPLEKVAPMRVMRFSAGKDNADYVMIRYRPQVKWRKQDQINGDVVVVLDTSAGGGESERQVRMDAVETILRSLSEQDRFAVVATDLAPRVIYPDKGLVSADETNVSTAMERLAEISSAGATDLGEMFGTALELVHDGNQPAVVYVGDGRATVGEISHDELAGRLRRTMGDSRARLFTIAVGDDANHPLLERLARVGGGRFFRINLASQTVREALRFAGMVKTPTITDLKIDLGAGLDQVFSTAAGKVSEGEEVIVLARTHHDIPDTIRVTGRLDKEKIDESYQVKVEKGDKYNYIPTIWARLYLERMMGSGQNAGRGSIISLGLTYALMTPFTSFLVLENNEVKLAQRDDEPQGGKGRRHKGEEGRMGKRSAKKTDNRYAIRGPRDNPNRPFGEDADLGVDPEVALGSLMGNQVGDNFGYGGLGIRGTGRGGGGTGEGTIGLGRLNTIGHGGGGGLGSGYGRAGGLGGRRGLGTKVKSGSAVVTGSLPKEIIRRIIHRHINEVKFCYERQLAKHPDLSGRVLVKFIINSRGTVQAAAVANSTLGDPPAEKCIANAVKRWTFPQPGGGGIVVVTYPFDLSNSRSSSSAIPAQIAAAPVPPAPAHSMFEKGVCSDTSTRPLYQKRIMWQRRLARMGNASLLSTMFFEAGKRCELRTWRDRKAILNLIESRAKTPNEVTNMLASFVGNPFLVKYLRNRVIRRAMDPDAVMSTFISSVDWRSVHRGLATMKTAEKRLKELRKILDKHPDDPAGRGLLVEILFDAELYDEALAEASRLHHGGQATSTVLVFMCDLLARKGQTEEAKRTCSELVEFNVEDPIARLRTGDLFLRHGWYDSAYRQYRTLIELQGEDPLSMMRLAAAAAGMGKVDEALRIERKVASGDGEPGPADPRLWARLHSATRLMKMIIEAKANKNADKLKALERGLKRTQVIPEPATMRILVWEDLGVRLDLVARKNDKNKTKVALANHVPAHNSGLVMIEMGNKNLEDVALSVELSGAPQGHPVSFKLYTLTWNGRKFTIKDQKGTLAVKTDKTVLTNV